MSLYITTTLGKIHGVNCQLSITEPLIQLSVLQVVSTSKRNHFPLVVNLALGRSYTQLAYTPTPQNSYIFCCLI